MKKLISLVMLVLCCSLVAAATPIISILSVNSGTLNTGDQIVAKVKVYDADGSNEIRRAFLAWDDSCNSGESWVDCKRTATYTKQVRYTCTMTVTPCMKETVPVYVVATNGSYETVRKYLGTYAFQGSDFPDPNTETPPPDITKSNLRPKEITEFIYKGEENISQRISGNIRFYDKSRTTGYVSISITTESRDRFNLKCRKLHNHTAVSVSGDFEVEMNFLNCDVKYSYYNYTMKNNRMRKKLIKEKPYEEDVKVFINGTNKKVNIESDSFELNGITGKYVGCWTESGKRKCGSENW